MLISIIVVGLGGWFFYSGWKFYHRMDWDESPESGPDFQQMHKRQAELLHIQDVLQQAQSDGKLSRQCLEEFNRFCDSETDQMKSAEADWRSKRTSRQRTGA